MGVTLAAWLAALQALLPPGRAFPRGPTAVFTRVLSSIASMFLAAQLRLEGLLAEMDPRAALTMLPDWERMLGLPDACAPTTGLSVPDRQRLAYQRLVEQGGQSRAYFLGLAVQLGEPNSWIDEFRPANCNGNCNGALNSIADAFTWRLNFRRAAVGARPGNCGDNCDGAVYLTVPALAQCPITDRKPAHTNVLFAYAATAYGPTDLQAYHTRASAAWAFDANGVLQQYAPNVLRVVPSPSGVLAALREPASTNYFTRSGDLTNAIWQKFDYSLPGLGANLLPNDADLVANGGGWTAGANLTRVGTEVHPSGMTAVIYEAPAGLLANVWLFFSLAAAFINSNRYKVAVWARVVSGAPIAAGNIAILETDFDGNGATNERRSIAIAGSGLDGTWRRFFLEATTGAAAAAALKNVYLLADWGGANGQPCRIAITEPRLVSTQGQADFCNITLNDPAVPAPDGTLTAIKLVQKDPNGLLLRQAGIGLAAGAYKPSIFCMYQGAASALNFNDDAVGVNAALNSSPSWQRIEFPVFNKAAGADFADFERGSDVTPLWLWLPQVEPGTVMTSPIVSGAAAGVRARDEISIPLDVKAGEVHSQFIDFVVPAYAGIVKLSNAAVGGVGLLGLNSVGNMGNWNGVAGVQTANTYVPGSRARAAAGTDVSGCSVCLSGGAVVANASAMPAMTKALLGQSDPGQDYESPVIYIHEFRTYRWRLSAGELQAVTA